MVINRSIISDIYVESLTRREQDVLMLLADNLTDREIAERLTLALSSVKWYTHQIYAKLAVGNRRQAVSRAREMGWFEARKPSSPAVHNLPRQLTPLIGRVKEISKVVEIVWEHPLVTLTGSGGVGKTRLALAVANDLLDDFSDGVRYVELAILSDPQQILREVMNVIGLHEEPGRTFLETLIYYFTDRQALLILDNAEHLVDASAELANTLLRSAPGLKVLATSREPLGVNGEAVYRVPSLPFPSPGPALAMQNLLQFESVQLFIDRARAVLPDFPATEENVAHIVQICQRLDGIPLAIELAASRAASLDVEQIAIRLEHNFRMLAGSSRTALERHRTLRTAIIWSYNLLTEAERLLLRRLGIFVGGWTLEAAEKTCTGEGIEQDDVLDLLSQLVNKSMVLAEIMPGRETRYGMLETIHQYALEELYRSGESEELRRRHCAWIVEMAETAEVKLNSREFAAWTKKLKADHDNLKASLDWSLGEGANPLDGLLILNALANEYWLWWGDPVQAYRWLEKGLSAINSEDYPSPILLIRTLSNLACFSSSIDWHLTTPLMEKGLALCNQLGAETRLEHARLLDRLGWHLAFTLGQLAEGLQALSEAESILRGLGPASKAELAHNLSCTAWVFNVQSDEIRGDAYVEECMKVYLEMGIERCVHKVIGDLALRKGNYFMAIQHYEMNMQNAREAEDEDNVADTYRKLGEVAKAQGFHEDAITLYRESLKIMYDRGNSLGINWLLACLAINRIQMVQNQATAEANFALLQAARILGADQALVEELRLPLAAPAEISQEYEQALKSLKESLSPAAFDAAWAEGRKMKLKQAVSYAMG